MMKYILFILIMLCSSIAVLLITSSFNYIVKREAIYGNVTITGSYTRKYSIVEGNFTYNGITYNLNSNSSEGYYYKKFNLKKGDIIYTKIIIVTTRNLWDNIETTEPYHFSVESYQKIVPEILN